MQFRLLGPLSIMDSQGRDVTPTAPKLRAVLALLVLRRNQVVHLGEITDELWGPAPPRRARSTIQTYMYNLRRIIETDRPGTGEATLRTDASGYRLVIPDEASDLHRFEALTRQGQQALSAGDPARAAETLARALSLWRGPALANVTTGNRLDGHAARLRESWLGGLELRLEADRRLGRHRALVGELTALVAEHPMHEGLHGRLMLALHGCDRRYEALEVYRRFRRLMVDELGLEPSPALAAIQHDLLAADPVPRPTAPPASTPASTPVASPPGTGHPADGTAGWRTAVAVPPVPADFVDRPGVLDRIVAALLGSATAVAAPPVTRPAGARIATIVGAPGTGKTALALRAAHQLTPRFTDGQIMVDLKGSQAEPTDPADALGTLLAATGLAPADLPAGLAERSRLFQRRTAGCRLLLILDDVASIAQVAPLLPGHPGCSVLATSCTYGLPGGDTVPLDPFDLADGVRMLARLVGERRVREDRPAADNIVRTCGGVPLALRAIGVRLASVPGWPLREAARRLADPRQRLDELRLAGLDVRARYDAAYQQLGRAERGLLRLLGLVGTREFTVDGLVRLVGRPRPAVEAALVRLVEHHLLQVRAGTPGAPVTYLVPELSSAYAQGRLSARAAVPPAPRRAGTLRSGHLLTPAV